MPVPGNICVMVTKVVTKGNRTGNISSDAVGSLSQYSETDVGNLCDMLGKLADIRVAGVVLREIPDENCSGFVVAETGRHRTGSIARADSAQGVFSVIGNLHALQLGTGF